jgi:hypothetical protein
MEVGLCTTAVLSAHFAYWVKIEPILRYLELINRPRWMPFWDGRFWEYKRHCVNNRSPLTWWWVYWGSLWTIVGVQVGLGFVL